MKRIAALYARVSTRRQEEEQTIASQIAAIEEYAQKQGYELRKGLYYVDEAVSGARQASGSAAASSPMPHGPASHSSWFETAAPWVRL